MIARPSVRFVLYCCGAMALCTTLFSSVAYGQWSRTYESFYLPGDFNWQFRRNFPGADRLFNGFDYGHAVLYETLWGNPGAPVSQLEEKEFDLLTKRILRNPPRLPLEETPLEVAYSRLAPEAKAMLDWAHVLHRQVYDVLADPVLSAADRDARVGKLIEYYRTRKDLAFSSRPKSMDLMDGQIYSLAFRQKYPKFSGLIWAYHWLQIGLYDPLLAGKTDAERKTLVNSAVSRFWQMLNAPPESMPFLMPMTAAVSPEFARRYPDLASIFDNLHMMHDVVADILASPEIPRSAKRKEILAVGALFRSDSAYALSYEDGVKLVEVMGANNMGGPSVGFSAALPVPTVARGMSMAGMLHGAAQKNHDGMNMPGMQMDMSGMAQIDDKQKLAALTAAFERMMADPVIRERVASDPVLQRLLKDLPGMSGMSVGAGMNMPAMGGMNMGGSSSSAEDRRLATEFVVRLLSDPSVQGRISLDPGLQRLWLDPEVQRRLAELKHQAPASPTQPSLKTRQDSSRKAPVPSPHKH